MFSGALDKKAIGIPTTWAIPQYAALEFSSHTAKIISQFATINSAGADFANSRIGINLSQDFANWMQIGELIN